MAKRMGLNGNGTANMIRKTLQKDESITNEGKKRNIPLELIDPNPDNKMIYSVEDIEPLAKSIEMVGYLESEAIGVFAKDDGRYEIYSGERRYRACLQIGMKEIPAIISLMPDEATKARMLISCNSNTRKVTPMQKAREIEYYERKVLDTTTDWKKETEARGDKRKYLALVFGMSESTIRRFQQLPKLIKPLQELIDSNKVNYWDAADMSQYTEEEQQDFVQLCTDFIENYNVTEDERIDSNRIRVFIDKIDRRRKEAKKKPKDIQPETVAAENIPENIPEIIPEKKAETDSQEAAFMNEPVVPPQTEYDGPEQPEEKEVAKQEQPEDDFAFFKDTSAELEEIVIEPHIPEEEKEEEYDWPVEEEEEYADEALAKTLDILKKIVNDGDFVIKDKRFVKAKMRGINEVIRRIRIKCTE